MSRDATIRLLASSVMVAVCAADIATVAAEPSCSAKSGPQTVALVELYTSEGCDSCPPADRWLATTFRSYDLRHTIPLAFHVDYWDRLGWKDRFAAPAYTERQYAESRAGAARFVYTPQVLVQGRDYPEWRSDPGRFAATVSEANARPPRAEIVLEAKRQDAGLTVATEVHVPNVGDRKRAALYVALVDSGFVSDVKAGENAGVRLAHDHVVRALRAGPSLDAAGVAKGETVLPWPAERGRAPTLVAFVQDAGTGTVLQALALPLEATACAPAPK